MESRNINGEVEGLMVHSRPDFAHIGEADAEFQQAWKFMRLISARRYADLLDRAPKAIAGMRVVMTHGRLTAVQQRCRRRPVSDRFAIGQEVFPTRARPFS